MLLSATCTTALQKIFHLRQRSFRALFYALFAFLCCFIPWHAWAKTTAKAPLIDISTCADLQGMSNNLTGQYQLTADIDCSGVDFSPIGGSSASFAGAFNGMGHKISNLSITKPTTDYVALFGSTNGSAQISQVVLEHVNVYGRNYVGALIGYATSSTAISKVQAKSGEIKGEGSQIGGLVGQLGGSSGSTIRDSSAAVTVKALGVSSQYTGGLVGYSNTASSSIVNSHATGAVSSVINTGGLVGFSNGGLISDSYATGTVNGSSSTGGLVGGFASSISLIRDYATGAVTGTTNVGGLIGVAGGNSSMSNSYARGSVNGLSNVGGLIGSATYTGITNTYSIGAVVGNSTTGGLIGSTGSGVTTTSSYWDTQTSGLSTSAGGTGKTTAEMYQQATYVNWDFTNVWGIHENSSYPWLVTFGQEIRACTDLQNINNDLGGVYRLVRNIDCNGLAFSPIGTFQQPFTGTLDGEGYTISNLEIKQDPMSFVGLFSAAQGANILDLSLSNVYVSGQKIIGSLVGYAFDNTAISNVSAHGTVEAIGSGDVNNVGGLIGVLAEGSVNYSLAAVTVNAANASIVGGLIGQNKGLVWNSYAIGAINGASNVGGLVGDNTGTLNNTYSTGKVMGSSNTGGLVGSGDGLAASSYWDTQTSGQTTSASGIGKTTTEMYQKNTYAGWDFDNIWNIYNGYTYPWLRTQVGQALVTKLK